MAIPVSKPTALKQGVATGAVVNASDLFAATDADGQSFTQYQFWDDVSGGGNFTVNNVVQAAGGPITVAAADLANTFYNGGVALGSERLYVRAMAGGEFSAWQNWDMYTLRATADTPAVVSAPAFKNALQDEWWRLSDIVQVSDANSDPIWRFEVRDNNSAAGSGYIFANGAPQLQGADVVVEESTLFNTWVRGGTALGTDVIEVRAFDGYEWSAWESFDLRTRVPNRAPAVTLAPVAGVVVGNSALASSLFSYSDLDSDPATKYAFWDDSAAGGHFTVGALTQTSGHAIEVDAGALGTVSYAAGAAAGSERLYVRAFDGELWSEWKTWLQPTLRDNNVKSVIDVPAAKNALQNEWWRLSDFIKVTDANNDPIVRFQIKDLTSGANSSYIFANGGQQLQGADVTVEESTLFNTWVRGGVSLGTDNYQIRVNDGYEWTDWAAFDLRTRVPNRAPVVTLTPTTGVVVGNSALASSLFTYSDLDSDPATKYAFWDDSAAGGHFTVGALTQTSGHAIEVDAGALGTVSYAAGAAAGSERLYVRAFDGELWSEWKTWLQPTLRDNNVKSVIDAPAAKNALQNEWWRLSDFIKVTDANNDPIVRFQIKDLTSGANSSYIFANGGQQLQGADVTVEESTLFNTWVRGGVSLGTDNYQIRVNDGYEWTDWAAFDLRTRVPNRAPVVTLTPTTGVVVGNSALASSLFTYSDLDSDPATKYAFWDDSAGGGHFTVGALTQTSGHAIEVDAGALGTVSYAAGAAAGSERLYVRAFDGELWSEWKTWLQPTLRDNNVKSVIDAPAAKNALQNEWWRLSDFIKVTDANNDPIVRFQIKDLTSGANSSYIFANGGQQLQGADVTVEESTLFNTWVRGGVSLGTDNYQIRVNDGYEWTDWAAFDLRTRVPNRAPVVTLTPTTGVVVGNSALASSLFTYSDLDSDLATKYAFWDDSAGGGHFTVGALTQTSGHAIEVDAGALGTVSYAAGAAAGSERLYVRAFDGELWSEWKTWLQPTLRDNNVKSVIDAPALKNAVSNEWWRLSDFIKVTDANNDPIVRFQIQDLTNTANGSYIFANGGQQLQGADVTVEESTLFNTWVRGGVDNGTDHYQIRVNDGYEWSDWKAFDLVTRAPNRLPVATATQAQRFVSSAGEQTAATEMFTVTDADGDALTYELWDETAGGGYWMIDGVSYAGTFNQSIPITAAQLPLAYYVGSGIAKENAYIRANDGTGFGNWAFVAMNSFQRLQENVFGNSSDSIVGDGTDKIYFGKGGNDQFLVVQTDSEVVFMGGVGADSYDSVAGTTMIVYENGNSAGDSLNLFITSSLGAVTVDGRHLVLLEDSFIGERVVVLIDWLAPANRIETFNLPGFSESFDQFRNRINGAGVQNVSWEFLGENSTQINSLIGFYNIFEQTASTNHAPVINLTGNTLIKNSTIAPTSLFTAFDADGNAIVQYEFTDVLAGNASLFLNGVLQASNSPLIVTPDQLSLLTYNVGVAGAADTLRVRAFDGETWSAPANIAVTPIDPPAVVSTTGAQIRVGEELAVGTFFTASTTDGDTITQYEFTDLISPANTNKLLVNGVVQAAGTPIVVSAANLSTVTYFGGDAGLHDFLKIRAFDGTNWSAERTIDIAPIVNDLPTVTAGDQTVRYLTTTASPGARLFDFVHGQDPDGQVFSYEITDNGSGGGQLVVNGVVQAAQTPILIAAAQLSNAYYVPTAASGSEMLSIRAKDMFSWGASTTVTMTSAPNARPATSGSGYLTGPFTPIAMSSLFSATDGDGDAIGMIEVRAPSSLSFNAGTTISSESGGPGLTTWRATSFSAFSLFAGANSQVYAMSARAFDGYEWGDWTDANLTVNGLPPDGAGNLVDLTYRVVTLSATPQTFHDWLGKVDGVELYDQLDFYSFTLAAPATVTFQIDGFTGSQEIKAGLLGPSPNHNTAPNVSGTPVSDGVPFNPATLPASGIALAAGTYYFELFTQGATSNTYYDLTLSAS